MRLTWNTPGDLEDAQRQHRNAERTQRQDRWRAAVPGDQRRYDQHAGRDHEQAADGLEQRFPSRPRLGPLDATADDLAVRIGDLVGAIASGGY